MIYYSVAGLFGPVRMVTVLTHSFRVVLSLFMGTARVLSGLFTILLYLFWVWRHRVLLFNIFHQVENWFHSILYCFFKLEVLLQICCRNAWLFVLRTKFFHIVDHLVSNLVCHIFLRLNLISILPIFLQSLATVAGSYSEFFIYLDFAFQIIKDEYRVRHILSMNWVYTIITLCPDDSIFRLFLTHLIFKIKYYKKERIKM